MTAFQSRVDERTAPALPGVPPPVPGVCRFCKVKEDQVDGDKLSWHCTDRTCCSNYACVRQHWAEIDRAKRIRTTTANRKRTPAEIHQLILDEKRAKRRRYREAAKARGLIRPSAGKGGA